MTLLVALLAGIFPVYPPGGYTGKIPIAGKYTIYFPGGAFDLRGYYGTTKPNTLPEASISKNTAILDSVLVNWRTFFCPFRSV